MPSTSDLNDAKQRLRTEALVRRRAARAAAVAERGEPVAERVRDHFLAAFDPQPGTPVSGFWPIGDEIDVEPLMGALDGRGCLCALPVVAGRGRPLTFRRWRLGDALKPGPKGTFEPVPECAEIVPSLVIVPLLAFDIAGRRIGYGAGYYDTTLARLRARGAVTTVGVAFAAQEFPDLPAGDGDEPLDWVVTEEGARQCAPGARRGDGD